MQIGKLIDLSGQTFGDFKVINFDDSRKKYQYYWICQCLNCGKNTSIQGAALRNGRITRCKCNPNYGNSQETKGYLNDLSGRVFGKFTVVEFSHKAHSHSHWICRCECGNLETHSISYINNSKFKMCKSCLKKYRSEEINKNKVEKQKIPFSEIQYQRKENIIEKYDEYTIYNGDIIIDIEDVEIINSLNRYITKNCSNYAYFNWRNKEFFLHRFLMGLPQAYDQKTQIIVDHINGNSLDNRKKNLRICKKEKNSINCKIYNNNTSGYKGVSYNKRLDKYQAYIQHNGESHYLGVFSSIEDAVRVRSDAEELLFGEFNRDIECLNGGDFNG